MTYCRCYSCKYLLRCELKTMWANFCVFFTDVVRTSSFNSFGTVKTANKTANENYYNLLYKLD